MHTIVKKWQHLSFKHLLWFTFALSLLLSGAELLPNGPIDPDSITFINAAHIYWQGGWHAALQVYPWPFFPIASIWLSHLCHLPLTAAFHLINTLAQALLCIAFVLISKQLGASLRTQKVAALVILLYPFLNSIRVYATRESGYWAFALLAVYFLLRFMTQRQYRYAWAFGISMGIAFLFRIEALIMLAAAPVAIFLMPHHRFDFKWRMFWRANGVLVALVLIAICYHFSFHHAATLSPNPGEKATRLQEFSSQLRQFLPHLSQQLTQDAQKLGQSLLTNDAKPTQTLLWVAGLVSLCLIITIGVMKPILAALALYGQRQGLVCNQYGQAALLYWLIAVNLAMLLLFTFEHYFLATRYPAFLTLLWLCWLPFALTTLYDRYKSKAPGITGRHWFFPTLMLILFFTALGGIVRFGYSKAYITQAGHWLYQSTPATATVLTNSKEVAFYAALANEDRQRLQLQSLQPELSLALQNPCRYDWIALRINHNDPENLKIQNFLQHHTAQKVFSNRRHDAVNIYNMQATCLHDK